MSDFYIVSTRHTQRQNEHAYITFWRPNDAGYCWPLSWAGKYSKDQIEAHPGYYSSGDSTFAVPCSVADAMGVAPRARTVDGDAGPVVPNTAENRQALVDASAFPTINPIEFEWFTRRKGNMGTEINNCVGCGRFMSVVQIYTSTCNHCGKDNRP